MSYVICYIYSILSALGVCMEAMVGMGYASQYCISFAFISLGNPTRGKCLVVALSLCDTCTQDMLHDVYT